MISLFIPKPALQVVHEGGYYGCGKQDDWHDSREVPPNGNRAH
jgi:hypothetical protein